jgi:hypoxanthine phosphoribosyltransferase
MSEKRYLGWGDVESCVRKLVEKIEASETKYDCILGLANGGLVPTCLIAKALHIKKVLTVSIKSYSGETAHEIQFLTSIDYKDLKGVRNLLIVDDLVDRGETLFEVEKILGYYNYSRKIVCKFDSAVLYTKLGHSTDSPYPRVLPTYTAETTTPDIWLVFPWELNIKDD